MSDSKQSGPANHLCDEPSLYLRQHAADPVAWYPWGTEAFAAAADTDRPVFLSIGYSSCHWCHVMARESFRHEAVAKLLNDRFISIKVDREERPDIDRHYMRVCNAMTGRGGWPLTLLLTPDKTAFFAATYLPRESAGGRSGLIGLLREAARLWREDRDRLLTSVKAINSALADRGRASPVQFLDQRALDRAAAWFAEQYDREFGGFGSRPKFPAAHNLRFLLRQSRRTGDANWSAMALHTLSALYHGGIWDHVGGGIHRYSTDREWRLPHFEKMLYDQANLLLTCAEAYQSSGDPQHKETGYAVVRYVRERLITEHGFVAGAEDADSNGAEGLYYTWTISELDDLLDRRQFALAEAVFHLDARGNVCDESTGRPAGRNVLYRTLTNEDAAESAGISVSHFRRELTRILARLKKQREQRTPPQRDDKSLTDWNSFWAAALCVAARAFADRSLLNDALTLLARYHAAFERGELGHCRYDTFTAQRFLDDDAYLLWATVEAYQSSGDPQWLHTAERLAASAKRYVTQEGDLRQTDHDREDIPAASEMFDNAYPCGHSVILWNLLRLYHLNGDTHLRNIVDRALSRLPLEVSRHPQGASCLLRTIELRESGGAQLVVVLPKTGIDRMTVVEQLGRPFLPNTVWHVYPEDAPPDVDYLRHMTALENRPTYYTCRGFSCEQPTHELEPASLP